MKRAKLCILFLLASIILITPSVNSESKTQVIILPLLNNIQADVGFVSYIYRKTTTDMYNEVINTTFKDIIAKKFPNEEYEIADMQSVELLLKNEGYYLNLLNFPDRKALKNIVVQANVRGIIAIEFFQFGTHFIPYKSERPWTLSCRMRAFDGKTNKFTDICFAQNEIYSGCIFGSGADDESVSKIVKDLVMKTMKQALENVSF